MTEVEKLETLKIMVGGSDTDEVLFAYLNLAGSKIIAKAYPYETDVTEVPAQYHYLQIEIATYLLNKRGAEGQTSHAENGITMQKVIRQTNSFKVNENRPLFINLVY